MRIQNLGFERFDAVQRLLAGGAFRSECKATRYEAILSEAIETEKSKYLRAFVLDLVHPGEARIHPPSKLGFVERLQLAIEEHPARDDR